MKKILFSVFALALAGCATSASRVIVGPDGTTNQLISCGFVSKCYEKATEICGKYTIVNTSSNTTGDIQSGVGTTTYLLVKCN